MDKHSYNISLKWNEGRKGIIDSPELPTKIEVATPPEFDKGVPGIWSPEHLYTASVLSCFMTTFLAIADYSKLEFKDFDCDAEGILDNAEGKFLMTDVYLKARLILDDDSKKERAERVLKKSEAACLITNSIKTKVHLNSEILIKT
ncbi:MAG TPA: OsmC family protein [Flavobacteriaceae bacterium]|nr:OsmC family protein [Flavobacteriaceae bacterium]